MTDENAQIIDGLNKDFLHTYLTLASRNEPVILHDGKGTPVRVEHITTHKFGAGRCNIIKNDVLITHFPGMRGCVTRNHQGQFIQVLTKALE